jgi:hypothetical protein
MATQHLKINSETPTSLSQYSENKIVVRKIKVLDGEIMDLFSPIKVITKLPTGEEYQYYINASSYFSNTKSGNETDIPMDLIIQYCRYTELIITPTSNKKIDFQIDFTIVEGEPLIIVVTQNLDGYTFSLPPESREAILSKFKDSRPIRSIFVGYDVKLSFESIIGKIEKHIIPALTDLSENQIDKFGQIKFINSLTGREIKVL